MRPSRLFFALVLFMAAGFPAAAADLVRNGGFEADELGLLSMWTTDAWVDTDEAVRFFTTEQVRFSGRRSFVIANLEPNDSRGIQWLGVSPNTLYKLSAWVMASDIRSEGVGANISVLGSTSAAGDLKETNGKWRQVILYGRTGPGQTALAVVIRLGFYNSLATGMAMFDDVKLEPLAALPKGAKAVNFGANEAAEVFPTGTPANPPTEEKGALPVVAQRSAVNAMPWIMLLTLAALAAATASIAGTALIVLLKGSAPKDGEDDGKKSFGEKIKKMKPRAFFAMLAPPRGQAHAKAAVKKAAEKKRKRQTAARVSLDSIRIK